MSLTINIVVKNNEETIESTLEQVHSICNKILIGDIGSSDKTISICKKYKKVEIISVPFKSNFSESKNYMLEKNDSWVMFLEPYESIVSCPDNLEQMLNDESDSYRIKTINNDLITKDLRIWNIRSGIKFKNPVFESAVSNDGTKNLDIFIASKKEYIDDEKIEILKEWRSRNPTHSEPLYYLSCLNLLQKKWKNFINTGETYLYRNNNNKAPSLMTRYYLAMVKTYVKTEIDYEGSLKYIISCIAEKPLMAEFWCLLGDIFYKNNELSKAKSIYQNALILGSRRIDNDELPIEISKYKNYPLKMIETCENIESKTQIYKTSK
jgi:tetratricopeptide (TPR) repeat protein